MVGSIPWLQSNNLVPFGHDPHPQQLLNLTNQIKTFTEGMDESPSDVKAIRSHVAQAERMVFLGFAFHPLNLELLLPESDVSSRIKPHRRLYATAFGISEGNKNVILEELARKTSLSNGPISIRTDLKCGGLIREYFRSLSLA